jgi:hypothetical protein
MPGVRRALAILLAVVASWPASALVSAAAAADEPGSVAIKLLEGPSNRADDPRASQYIVDHLEPGARISRRVQVDNRTASAATIQLYAAAAAVEGGAFTFGEGRAANELTGWTTVEPSSVTVPAGQSAVATVHVSVPSSVKGGERYGVVWAELPGVTGNDGVTVVNRVGVRMYVSVGGSSEPPTSFELKTFTPLRATDGKPAVEIAACNDGGRAVDLEGRLDLSDGPGSTSAGPFTSAAVTTLAPGDCGTVVVPIPGDLPRGPWRAKATLRSGNVERVAEAALTFPAAPIKGDPVPAKRVTESGSGRLLIVLAILLLLAALAMLAWWWARQRRGDEVDATLRPMADM